jgi:3-phenylpropionate/trans-cinnamate dioxygenase ferredoxin subunit
MQNFVPVASLDELGPGKTKRIRIADHPILLANVDGNIYACDDNCTHEDSSLYLGCLKGELISCTLHGSRFSVVTGEPQDPPATIPLKTYEIKVEDGEVFINPEAR